MHHEVRVELLERRVVLSAGDLNAAFGDHGVITHGFGGDVSNPQVVVDSQGRIVVAMQVTPAKSKTPHDVIARFLADGTIDSTFGTGGEVLLDGGSPTVDHHDRILFCTPTGVTRLTTSGAIDKGFGNNGSAAIANATSVAVAPDGKLVVTTDVAIERFSAGGAIDHSFGVHGKYTLPTVDVGSGDPVGEAAYDPVVAADGSIYFLYKAGDFPEFISSGVTKLTAAGKVDQTFDDGGSVSSTAFGQAGLAEACTLTSAGNIAISNSCDDGGTEITEFDSHGQPVKGFGPDGIVVVYNGGDWDASLSQDSAGDLVCTATTGDSNALDIIRLQPDGTFDRSFAGGESAFGFDQNPAIFDQIRSAVLPNRNIVFAMPDATDETTSSPIGLRISEVQGTSTASSGSASVSLSASGMLTVRGTTKKDAIDVEPDRDDFQPVDQFMTVEINGTYSEFYQPGVSSISIDAGAGNDSIQIGQIAPATVMGGAGNDQLTNQDNAALLSGGAGNDVLTSYQSSTLVGGAGEDVADFSVWTDPLTVTLDNKANDGSASRGTLDVESSVEDIIGGTANDLIIGDSADNHLYGGPGNDTLQGGVGDDTLEGGHGHDQLFGQAGDDLLIARDKTSDTLDGGDGLDAASRDDLALVRDQAIGIESFI